MSNINSEYIQVFPTTRRLGKSVQSRQTSEQNITRLVNMLLDVDGFVISKNLQSGLEFNIHGYYFKITLEGLSQLQSQFQNQVYASIRLSSATTENPYVELQGQDNNGLYEGVNFSSTKPSSGPGIYSLKILEKQSGQWSIPAASMYKFTQISISNFNVDIIDGGEIS